MWKHILLSPYFYKFINLLKDIASERDYLSLFSRSAILEGANKLSVVSDLITLTDLSTPDLAKFLRDKIVTATIEFNSTDLAVPVILWDVSLDSDFHLIINLINNPSLLGSELLQASTNLPCSTGTFINLINCVQLIYQVVLKKFCKQFSAVQILIRAHDCFTSSWNVEGIGRVLRRARILASLALQEEQWQYLVKY